MSVNRYWSFTPFSNQIQWKLSSLRIHAPSCVSPERDSHRVAKIWSLHTSETMKNAGRLQSHPDDLKQLEEGEVETAVKFELPVF